METGYTYDVADRVTELVQARGSKQETTTTYAYDAAGNLIQTKDACSGTDALGNTTTYEYDLMDRCIKETNAIGKSEKYVYDRNGRLKEVTDREGNLTVYQYDAAGRLIREKTGLFETTYTYDATGNL